jgi:hypothetical protein
MREIFTVRSVTPNNGIRRVHLTHDFYRNEFSQPIEMILNINSEMYQEGDEWLVHHVLVRRAERKSLSTETPT